MENEYRVEAELRTANDGKNGCLEKISKNLNRKMLENIFEKRTSIKISLTLADVSNLPAMQNETL